MGIAKDTMERIEALVDANVDVIAVDTRPRAFSECYKPG